MPVSSALYLLAALVAQPAHSTEPPSGEQAVVDKIKACGFPHLRVTYEPKYGWPVITVLGISSASQESLRCAAQASLDGQASLDTVNDVNFPHPLDQEYDRLYWPMARKQSEDQGRERLAQRGLLDKLPPYHKGDDLAYARQLETLCGPAAKGAFTLYMGYVNFNAGTHLDDNTFGCLLDAMWASGMPQGPGWTDPWAPQKN